MGQDNQKAASGNEDALRRVTLPQNAQMIFKGISKYIAASDENSNQYAVYCIEVACQDATPSAWQVYRRYKQFETLRNELASRRRELPALPSKNFPLVQNMDPDHLQRRQNELEAWLNKVLTQTKDTGTTVNAVVPTDLMDLFTDFFTLSYNSPPTSGDVPNEEKTEPPTSENASNEEKTEPPSERYEGEHQDGKRHGQGKLFLPDNSWYEGEFKDGDRHGQGKYQWENGDVYEGGYKDSLRHGRGIYTSTRGDRYEGEWMNGKRHGRGTYNYSNGVRYEGEFQMGKRHGHGITYYQDGSRFEGEYNMDKQHGKGRFFKPNDEVGEEQIWQSGQKQ